MFLALLTSLLVTSQPPNAIFARDNLVAWCIVPFDAKKRGPVDRVAMLKKLGFKKYAYDWRAEHLPTFEQEILELKKHDIELTAVWFPSTLNKDATFILDTLQKHKIKTQLWVMLTEAAPGQDQAAKVKAGAAIIHPLAEAAGKIGCRVSLYKHGGWGGEPENQLAVIDAVKLPNVGIVYNLHHGHDQVNRFEEHLKKILPKLDAVSLNGMETNGDKNNRKILILGHGDNDVSLLKIIRNSGYRGPIAILGHTHPDDVQDRLQDNLDGLNWLLPQLDGKPADPKPKTRTTDPAPKHTVRFSTDLHRIEVTGAPPAVTVVVANGSDAEIAARPAIPGTSKIADGVLQFTPRFPFTPGVKYRVTVGDYQTDHVMPKPLREPTTTVSAVYPAADKLPENTLRFYLHFSKPMTRGDVYKYIKLLGSDGKEVVLPFLELDEELWSADSTRFTLFFDPGRVKRGLKPREEAGPSLEEGKNYTLVIDRAWEDENGVMLREAYRKKFSVSPPDDTAIDPTTWKCGDSPRSGTSASYTIRFGAKSLDHALVQRMIWVVGPDGRKLDGTVRADEQSWSFKPTTAWHAATYQVVIDTRLEDPCGNRVGRPFEIDVFEQVQKTIVGKTVELKFVVK